MICCFSNKFSVEVVNILQRWMPLMSNHKAAPPAAADKDSKEFPAESVRRKWTFGLSGVSSTVWLVNLQLPRLSADLSSGSSSSSRNHTVKCNQLFIFRQLDFSWLNWVLAAEFITDEEVCRLWTHEALQSEPCLSCSVQQSSPSFHQVHLQVWCQRHVAPVSSRCLWTLCFRTSQFSELLS